MTNELKKKWDLILDYPEVYVYGAAKTAEKLYEFIANMGYKDNVKGFLVTNGEDNGKELCGLPVDDIHYFDNKKSRILVPHVGIYRDQICNLLETLNFRNVFLIDKLRELTYLEEREKNTLDVEKTGWEIYERKSEKEKQEDEKLCDQILNILREEQPDFGGIKPYQSMELIGLEGIRPTEYRIREYGLRDILKEEDDVLDIGCNTGCLDISIANMVHTVTGIEYDGSLVKAAKLIADYLEVSNCAFYNDDFNVWLKDIDINKKYSIILSFAIHHWLNLSPTEYIAIIDKLLKKGGFLCFESHIYGMDVEFDECYKEFLNLGYHIICEKKIKDDGVQERLYVLFQKNEL